MIRDPELIPEADQFPPFPSEALQFRESEEQISMEANHMPCKESIHISLPKPSSRIKQLATVSSGQNILPNFQHSLPMEMFPPGISIII